MKTLESIVPPWDLCKQIPDKKNNFRDSIFAWVPRFRKEGNHRIIYAYELYLRPAYNDSQCIPAPTLEEILAEIDKILGIFHISVWTDECLGWNAQTISEKKATTLRETEQSAATAALKLWLELEEWKEAK